MPRLYTKLLVPLTLIFLIPLLIVLTVGIAQPQTLGLQGFATDCDNQSQPCWYGISLESAWSADSSAIWGDEKPIRQPIQFYDAFSLQSKTRCNIQAIYTPRDGIVWTMSIMNCGIRVGDVMQYFGEPDNVDFVVGWSYERMEMRYLFDKGIVMVIHPGNTGTTPSPGTFVQRMNFHYCNQAGSDCEGMRWHGFLSARDYCQIEPEYSRCPAILVMPQPITLPIGTLPPG